MWRLSHCAALLEDLRGRKTARCDQKCRGKLVCKETAKQAAITVRHAAGVKRLELMACQPAGPICLDSVRSRTRTWVFLSGTWRSLLPLVSHVVCACPGFVSAGVMQGLSLSPAGTGLPCLLAYRARRVRSYHIHRAADRNFSEYRKRYWLWSSLPVVAWCLKAICLVAFLAVV
jgi:hypothetical protein